MPQIINDDKEYGTKLINLGFEPNLYASHEQCKQWYNYCLENNMVYVKNSNRLLIHEKLKDYFKIITDENIREELGDELWGTREPKISRFSNEVTEVLDHLNYFYFTKNPEIQFITNSPYNNHLKKLEKFIETTNLTLSVINPKYMNYSGFVLRKHNGFDHPLLDLNYAFFREGDAVEIIDFLGDELDMFLPFIWV